MLLKYFLVLILWMCFVTLSAEAAQITCIVCDSETDGEKCITNSNVPCKLEDLGKSQNADQCFTYHIDNVVKRGHVIKDSQCQNDDDKGCKLCKNQDGADSTPCNTECINPITCLECDSSKDGKCLDGTSGTSCSSSNLVCQQCFDAETSILKRKCGKSSSLTCGTCVTEKCNDGLTCYTCIDGENCAASPGQATISPKDAEGCFVKINSDYKTERGYLAKGASCETGQNCKRTEGHLSNTGTFADDHLKCYQCSDDNNCKAEQTGNENLKACEYYTKGDYCYIATVDEKIYRGCGSDKNGKCTTEKCRQCSSGNGCNSMKSTYQPKLKCITCGESDETCILGSPSSEAKQCTGLLPFYQDEFCYVKKNGEKKVKRGCGLADGETDCENNKNCDMCYADGCNNKNYFKQTCARCRDDIGSNKANCTEDGKTFIGNTCPKGDEITKDTQGCYVMRHDGVIYRGCLVDLPIDDMHMCLKNNTNDCQTCSGVDCNTFKLPNGSPHSAEIGFAMLLLAIAALFNRKIF